MKPSKPLPPRPTQAELEILSALWERGPSSVREVREHVATATRRAGYTTVLKLLQIMVGKGLVVRDESERSHVYRAAVAREQTQRQLVSDLVERAFGGSASQLIQQALATRRASPQEMREIRHMLERTEGDKP
jgi:predicted transcriptional regulator